MVDKKTRKKLIVKRIAELSDQALFVRAAMYMAAVAARCADTSKLCQATEELKNMGYKIIKNKKNETEAVSEIWELMED